MTFNNVRPDRALHKYVHADLILRADATRDACRGRRTPTPTPRLLSTSGGTWLLGTGARRSLGGSAECWDVHNVTEAFFSWRRTTETTETTQHASMFAWLGTYPGTGRRVGEQHEWIHTQTLLVLYTHRPYAADMESVDASVLYDDAWADENAAARFRPKRFVTSQGVPATRFTESDAAASSSAGTDGAGGAAADECGLRPWYVTFDRLGWGSWIITPKGFDANYCEGQCASPLNMTNHAFIKKIYRKRYGYAHLPAASCVPTALEPMSVLFTTENGTIYLRRMPQMRADGCGCL